MEFKIDESSRLTIIDDKKEIIISTDKSDLKILSKLIDKHINQDSKEEKVGSAYGYNPRTKRIEPLKK